MAHFHLQLCCYGQTRTLRFFSPKDAFGGDFLEGEGRGGVFADGYFNAGILYSFTVCSFSLGLFSDGDLGIPYFSLFDIRPRWGT